MEKELRNEMENVLTDLAYKIFKVTTAKEDDNKLLNKAEKSIEKYKDKMSQEEYEKFKYFLFGYRMIDMHIKRPESIILTNIMYDIIIKEKEKEKDKKEEEISLDMFGDIEKQLDELLNGFKRL
jgi:hypothetical protein